MPRSIKPATPAVDEPGDAQRLHKILAQAGVGSRRSCEMLILEGRVTVDGEVIRELGTKVDPAVSKISVDGQRIKIEPHVYYLVYKPKGYVSTSDDPSGRPLVLDLVPKAGERIFIVGRLDRHSEGLMLLTNDGALAQRLTHPSYGVEKTYRVTVAGDAGHEVVDKLTEGVWLAEGKVRARRARIVAHRGNVTILEIVLAEGKNREIRRMLARLDHKVLSLLRVAIGPLQLKGISEGAWRSLSAAEVERLRTSTTAEDTDDEDHRPRKPAARAPRPMSSDRAKSGMAPDRDRSGDRKPGKYGTRSSDSSPDRERSGDRKPGKYAARSADAGPDRERSGDRKPGKYAARSADAGPDRERSGDRKPGKYGARSSDAGPGRDRSGDRTPGKFGAKSSDRRPFDKSSRPKPPARTRPEPPENFGDDEDMVFTDRMDFGDRPDRSESKPDSFRPRGDRPRPDRGRSDEDRPDRRERGPGGPRPRGGKPVGKGRPGISRDDKPGQPKRTVLGQPREPGKPVPKRRGGPSRGLPPRRRRPKG